MRSYKYLIDFVCCKICLFARCSVYNFFFNMEASSSSSGAFVKNVCSIDPRSISDQDQSHHYNINLNILSEEEPIKIKEMEDLDKRDKIRKREEIRRKREVMRRKREKMSRKRNTEELNRMQNYGQLAVEVLFRLRQIGVANAA